MAALPETLIRRWILIIFLTIGISLVFLAVTQMSFQFNQKNYSQAIDRAQTQIALLHEIDASTIRLFHARNEKEFTEVQSDLAAALQRLKENHSALVDAGYGAPSVSNEALSDLVFDSENGLNVTMRAFTEKNAWIPALEFKFQYQVFGKWKTAVVSELPKLVSLHQEIAQKYKEIKEEARIQNVIFRLILAPAVIAVLFLEFLYVLRQMRQQVRKAVSSLSETKQRIEKEKELLDTTVGAINQGITLFDKDGILQVANDKFYKLFQMPKTEYPLGTHSRHLLMFAVRHGFLGSGDNEKLIKDFYEYLDEEAHGYFEATNANGKIFGVQSHAIDGGGNVLVYTDITDQRVSERWIESMNNQLTTVIDATGELGVGIAFFDENYRLIVSNRVYYSLADPKDYEVPGEVIESTKTEDDDDLFDLDDVEVLPEFLVKQIEGDVGTHQYVRTSDSRVISISHAGFEQGSGLIICMDITEQKMFENRLKSAKNRADLAKVQAEDAYNELRAVQKDLVQAEKMAALGRLVAGVAHEINTPIGNTLTTTTVMRQKLEDVEGKMNRKELKYSHLVPFFKALGEGLRISETNIHRAHELIQSFKQVSADQTSSILRDVNLSQLIEEIVISVKPQFARTDHKVEIDVPADIDLKTYPGPLQQVFTNLLTNAVIHGFDKRNDGTIWIEATRADNDKIKILVSDNGSGIPKEYLDKIYDPFFTTKRGSGGTGLGLNIVYTIVQENLGGKISVKETSEKGTTFELVLPIAIEDKSAQAAVV